MIDISLRLALHLMPDRVRAAHDLRTPLFLELLELLKLSLVVSSDRRSSAQFPEITDHVREADH